MMCGRGVAVWLSCAIAAVLLLTAQGRGSDTDGHRDKRSDDLGAVQAVLATQAQRLSMLEAQLQSTKAELHSATASRGSSFVRWGRSTCPALNGNRLLYSGFAGGTNQNSKGGGANRLCLTKEPVFDDTPGESFDSLNGVEYYILGHHYTDALCAVCHTPQSVTYMIPGTNRCPAGSLEQYHGWLTAGNANDPASSEFLCLDAAPEDRPGSQGIQDSGYFEHVKSHCGALPCPPYAEGKLVTCVVCSV